MTRVLLTWQKDSEHSEDFDEEVTIGYSTSLEQVEEEETIEMLGKNETSSLLTSSAETQTRLRTLEREATYVVLEECLEQLLIIRHMVNVTVRPNWTRLLQYTGLSDKFLLRGDEFNEEVYEKIPYTDPKKFIKDLCMISTTVREGAYEIISVGSFAKILDVIECLQKEKKEYREVEMEVIENERILKELGERKKREKEQFDSHLVTLIRTINELELELERSVFWGRQELRYVQDWERARTFQQNLAISQSKEIYFSEMANYRVKMELDMRVRAEIESYYREVIEDMNSEIQRWMEVYDESIEKIDREIEDSKERWELSVVEHETLVVDLKQHKIDMDAWLILREYLRRMAAIEKAQQAAVTIIQRWWRGMMVRLFLGKFKSLKKEVNERQKYLNQLAARLGKNKKK